jgi:hypothetical protein
MRGPIAWTIVVVSVLSLWWTTWKARRILGQSLGRKLRDGEETSLKSWMQVPNATLDSATAELKGNPFERFLRTLAKFDISKGDMGAPPEDRTVLK